MNETLIEQIDQYIEASREDLTKDIIRLIGIKSVKGEPLPGAPFGCGPQAVLEAVLKMGEQEGFDTTDYKVGVVSLALKRGKPDLGIWLHGDVVPEGTGWDFDPYQATAYKGCVIGRGATDNKGQLCAIFHLLKIFKALNIPLNYNPALYVGSNEESGKHDVKAFCAQYCPPRLSLVPDSLDLSCKKAAAEHNHNRRTGRCAGKSRGHGLWPYYCHEFFSPPLNEPGSQRQYDHPLDRTIAGNAGDCTGGSTGFRVFPTAIYGHSWDSFRSGCAF